MSTPRIDVIGAGISGLASAYYLARALPDLEIHVWERDRLAGGLAGSFSTADFTVEKFYHHIYRRDLALQALIAECGLGGDLIWRPASTGAYYQRQPFRLSSPSDLLRFKPLPLLDRLRLGGMVVRAKLVRHWHDLDDITAADYVRSTAGETVYRVVWQPLLRGKFGEDGERVSAAWLWSKLVDRGGSRGAGGHEVLGYLRGGLGRLFEELIVRLERMGHHVHLGTGVEKLEGGLNRIERVVTREGTFATNAVISGAQLPDLIRLLPEAAGDYGSRLGRIGYLGCVCLVLTLKAPLSEFYWTNVVAPDAPFIGIIEQTRWADRAEFGSKHVAYISAYVAKNDPRHAMEAGELLESYLPAIRTMFPDFASDSVEGAALWKAAYAQPIVHVGYRRSIPAIESPIPNLFLCTMAQIYPHDRQVSNGVEMAHQTAAAASRWLVGRS